VHSVLLVLAATGTLGLLAVVSVGVANLVAAMANARTVLREADGRPGPATAWDGIERRTGVDRRWRDPERSGTAQDDRRVGGRRAGDVAPAARMRAA